MPITLSPFSTQLLSKVSTIIIIVDLSLLYLHFPLFVVGFLPWFGPPGFISIVSSGFCLVLVVQPVMLSGCSQLNDG